MVYVPSDDEEAVKGCYFCGGCLEFGEKVEQQLVQQIGNSSDAEGDLHPGDHPTIFVVHVLIVGGVVLLSVGVGIRVGAVGVLLLPIVSLLILLVVIGRAVPLGVGVLLPPVVGLLILLVIN